MTRGLNLGTKDSNALVLNNYVGAIGVALFFFDTLFQFDHLVLLIHFAATYVGGIEEKGALIQLSITGFLSVVCVGLFNLQQDYKLKEVAGQINDQLIEKFAFQTKRKAFKMSSWGSIKKGDVIKVKRDKEIPCDCLILNITGSKLEH